VTEVIPGIALVAVILAHRAPLPLTQYGPTIPPGNPPGACLLRRSRSASSKVVPLLRPGVDRKGAESPSASFFLRPGPPAPGGKLIAIRFPGVHHRHDSVRSTRSRSEKCLRTSS